MHKNETNRRPLVGGFVLGLSFRVHSIWKSPAYLPHVQLPLTADAIADAELRLGVTLPSSFLNLLREQNGGYLRCTLPNSVHVQIRGIGASEPNVVDQRHWLDLASDEQPRGANLLVPFDGDGHWYLCLDYRSVGPSGEPSVSYIDVEMQEEEGVALDFAAFLAMLRQEFSNPTWGIKNMSARGVAGVLERALGARFGDENAYDFGYPIRRARFDTGNGWAWLSSNKVPRAYARKGDHWSAAAAKLLKGEALQVPEYPDVDTILSCTPPVATLVANAVASLDAVKIADGLGSP